MILSRFLLLSAASVLASKIGTELATRALNSKEN